jgi:predicted ribosomally synthesized peptide with nif11-like leader
MSIEDLTAFFAKLESDEALQDEALALQGARGEERLAGLTSLAAAHGFTVTAADWEHEAAGPAIAALEDEKLRNIAGGGCGEAAGAYGAQGGSLGAAGGSCGCGQGAGALGAQGQSLGLSAGGCG